MKYIGTNYFLLSVVHSRLIICLFGYIQGTQCTLKNKRIAEDEMRRIEDDDEEEERKPTENSQAQEEKKDEKKEEVEEEKPKSKFDTRKVKHFELPKIGKSNLKPGARGSVAVEQKIE